MAESARRRAYIGAAIFFATVTAFVLSLFVVKLVTDHEIRSGLLTYGAFTLVATIGLGRQTRWGRSLALVVAMGNMGLGTLTLLAVIFTRDGSPIVPAVLLAISLAVAYVLSRSVYNFPYE